MLQSTHPHNTGYKSFRHHCTRFFSLFKQVFVSFRMYLCHTYSGAIAVLECLQPNSYVLLLFHSASPFLGGCHTESLFSISTRSLYVLVIFLFNTGTPHSSPFVHLFPYFFMLYHFVSGIVLVWSLPGLSSSPVCLFDRLLRARWDTLPGERLVLASKSQCEGESYNSAQSTLPAFNLRSVIFPTLTLIQYTLTLFLQEEGSRLRVFNVTHKNSTA